VVCGTLFSGGLRISPLDLVTEIIPSSVRLVEKWRIFHTGTITLTFFFVKHDEIVSKLIKFKHESIKLKKECEAELV
jgi:hypothetical protein